MAQSLHQRQITSRARKKAAGFTRIALQFNRETVALLRQLAKRNKSTQAATIALGLHLLDDRELLNQLREQVAAKRAILGARRNAQEEA